VQILILGEECYLQLITKFSWKYINQIIEALEIMLRYRFRQGMLVCAKRNGKK
jgi:hypothetical protein